MGICLILTFLNSFWDHDANTDNSTIMWFWPKIYVLFTIGSTSIDLLNPHWYAKALPLTPNLTIHISPTFLESYGVTKCYGSRYIHKFTAWIFIKQGAGCHFLPGQRKSHFNVFPRTTFICLHFRFRHGNDPNGLQICPTAFGLGEEVKGAKILKHCPTTSCNFTAFSQLTVGLLLGLLVGLLSRKGHWYLAIWCVIFFGHTE